MLRKPDLLPSSGEKVGVTHTELDPLQRENKRLAILSSTDVNSLSSGTLYSVCVCVCVFVCMCVHMPTSTVIHVCAWKYPW
jgi:hypothetical protein